MSAIDSIGSWGYLITARIKLALCEKIMAVVSADSDPYSSLYSIKIGQPIGPASGSSSKPK